MINLLKRLFVGTICAISLVFNPAVAFVVYAQSFSSMAQARTTVGILVSNNSELFGSCSAVVVAPEVAMTAAHCIDIPALKLKMDDGRSYLVSSIAVEESGADQAWLNVPGLTCPCAEIATYPALQNELTYAVGYPYGIANTLTTGLVQGRVMIRERVMGEETGRVFGPFLLTSNLIAPGNSGGALFVVRNDRVYLIGITVAMLGSNHMALSTEVIN